MKKILAVLTLFLLLPLAAHAEGDGGDEAFDPTPHLGNEYVVLTTYFPAAYGAYRSLDVTRSATDSLTMNDGFIQLSRTGGTTGIMDFVSRTGSLYGWYLNNVQSTFTAFSANNAEVMRVASNGAVGIGTTNPQGVFQVNTRPWSDPADKTRDYIRVNRDQNVGLELHAGGPQDPGGLNAGTCYIDFSNDSISDYDGRIRLLDNDNLSIDLANLGIGLAPGDGARGRVDVRLSGDTTHDLFDDRQIAVGNRVDFSSMNTPPITLVGSNLYFRSQLKAALTDPTAGSSGVQFYSQLYSGTPPISIIATPTVGTTAGAVVNPQTVASFDRGTNFLGIGMNADNPFCEIQINNPAGQGMVMVSGTGGGSLGDPVDPSGNYSEVEWSSRIRDKRWIMGYDKASRELQFYNVRWNGSRVYAMRIKPNGMMAIGNIDAQFQLDVNGTAMNLSGSADWHVPSDRRLKHDIAPLEGALERLLALRGVTYKWNEPAKHGDETGTMTGMIAQEVEEVFPGWVETGSDGYKSLTYNGFEAVAVESLRALAAENARLAAENDKLEKGIAEIEAALNARPGGGS